MSLHEDKSLTAALSSKSAPTSPAQGRRARIWELERELEKKKQEKLQRSRGRNSFRASDPSIASALNSNNNFDDNSAYSSNNNASPTTPTLKLSSPLRENQTPEEKKRKSDRKASLSDDEEKRERREKGAVLQSDEKQRIKKKNHLSANFPSLKDRKVRSSPQLRAFASKIDRKDLKLVRKIGEGSFGVVWEGECFQGPVAIKVNFLSLNVILGEH
jgi:hypothetical protein